MADNDMDKTGQVNEALKYWLYTARTARGERVQGVVRAGSARQALEVIGREFPQLDGARVLNGDDAPFSLEEAARQRFGVPPEAVTARQWSALADELAADWASWANRVGWAQQAESWPQGVGGTQSDAPSSLRGNFENGLQEDLTQGLLRVAGQQRNTLLALGVALAMALFRQWPWWAALLVALGMAAPFVMYVMTRRHVLQHRQGLRAALLGDEPLLRARMQALTEAALHRPWLPEIREMAWELAFFHACMTARQQGAEVARAQLLAHPCRPPSPDDDEEDAGPHARRGRGQPLGVFEYLLQARAGDHAAAAVALENLLAAEPQQPALLMDLAITRARLGQFDEARRLLAQVDAQALPPYIAMYEQGIRGLLALDDTRHADPALAVALLTAASRTALQWTQHTPLFWWSATSFACELALALARNGQPQAAGRALACVQRLAPQCVDPQRLQRIRDEVARAQATARAALPDTVPPPESAV